MKDKTIKGIIKEEIQKEIRARAPSSVDIKFLTYYLKKIQTSDEGSALRKEDMQFFKIIRPFFDKSDIEYIDSLLADVEIGTLNYNESRRSYALKALKFTLKPVFAAGKKK